MWFGLELVSGIVSGVAGADDMMPPVWIILDRLVFLGLDLVSVIVLPVATSVMRTIRFPLENEGVCMCRARGFLGVEPVSKKNSF